MEENQNGCAGIVVFLAILVMGFIYVITSPNFLDPAHKAREAEGRTIVGSMNRAQQAYQLEKKSFSNSLAQLGLDIDSTGNNYSYNYSISLDNQAAFNYAVPKKENTKAYVGGVFETSLPDGKSTTTTILCQAQKPMRLKPANPINQNGVITCGSGTSEI